jgi:hypothetical protein
VSDEIIIQALLRALDDGVSDLFGLPDLLN